MDRLFGKTVQRRAVGFTLIEALVAMVLASICFALLWNFWGSSRRSEEQLSTGFSAQQDLSLAMNRISYELREGISIFYPTPDQGVKEGIGFVSSGGCAITFYVEPQAEGGGILYRVDLGTKEKKVITRKVNYFKVRVEPAAPGKKACLANLNLSILRGKEDVTGKMDDYNIVKKVFLRNLKQELPE